MKGTFISILLIGSVAVPALAAEKIELKTEGEQVSYAIGFGVGSNLKTQVRDADTDLLHRGVTDAFGGRDPLLSIQEQRQIMRAFQKKQRVKAEAKHKEDALINKELGTRFLSDNKGKPGVVTLDSGLQYKVMVEGKGPKPKESDTVETHYRGTLIDGTEFDSSYTRGKPASFPVMGVIRGWTEALQLMNVGSKWMLYVPPDLAYGDRGAGGTIGPGSTLIFEIELLKILKK